MMRVYQLRFLRTLKRKAIAKARKHPDAPLDVARIEAARGIVDFDDCVTAPLYGLGSAADYYAWASSGPKLHAIRTPSLLITALDDPLAPAWHLPAVNNPALTMCVTEGGGHCGFVGKGLEFWAEAEAMRFLAGRQPQRTPRSQ